MVKSATSSNSVGCRIFPEVERLAFDRMEGALIDISASYDQL